ncbi:MAG: hypothetical protein ACKVQJ_13980 [Pyrinomonadaceae bacterium]
MPRCTVWIILVLVGLIAACGSGSEWKGKISGESEITDNSRASIEKATGSAKLEEGLDRHLILGKDTPLSECDLRFGTPRPAPGTVGLEYPLVVNPDKSKCKATLGKGTPPVDVSIGSGTVTITDSGEVTAIIDYYAPGAAGRIYTLKGKKGWF